MYIPKFVEAAVLWKVGKPLKIEKIKIPDLKRGQVLVKLDYSGVCHSQLMEYKGKRGKDRFLPHLLGHEGSGKVIAVDNSVKKVKVGDKVILGWIKGKGIEAKGAKYKHKGAIINSGPVTTFSNFSIVSENRLVVKPPDLPNDIAVLFGCALPTGAGIIINEIKPIKGSSILFVGLGAVGLSALLTTNIFDCKHIIAVDINQKKLDFANKFGATQIINASKSDPRKLILKTTNYFTFMIF